MNKENILSVYKKLQMARLALVQTTLKKSGRNKFAGYEYFELGDFIPYAVWLVLMSMPR